MEMASIKSAIETSATRGPVSVLGQVNLLSDSGEILNLWRAKEPRCSIGSGPGNTISLPEPSIAAEHALVVFGKNRTLVKALGSAVRIAGRSVSETLIDEPTLVQCGNVRLLIIPPRFANREDYAAHQVSSGTLADQTARLRNYPHVATSRVQPSTRQENNSVEEIAALASPISEVTKPMPAWQPTPALDLSPILSALAPIQSAISETKDSLASLQSRVQESEARSESQEIAQDLRPDLSQLIDRIDQRMGAFTNQCESLFSTVAESLDSRFNQLGDLVQKLCESSLPPTEHTSGQAILENEVGEHRATYESPFSYENGSSEVVSPLLLDDDTTEESSSYEAVAYQPTYVEPIDYKTEFEQSATGYSTLEDTFAEQPAYEETFAEPSTFAAPSIIKRSTKSNSQKKKPIPTKVILIKN